MKPKIYASPSFVPMALILGSIVGLAVMGLGTGILVSAVVDTGEFVWSRADYLINNRHV